MKNSIALTRNPEISHFPETAPFKQILDHLQQTPRIPVHCSQVLATHTFTQPFSPSISQDILCPPPSPPPPDIIVSVDGAGQENRE
jgi:hypothetical protein